MKRPSRTTPAQQLDNLRKFRNAKPLNLGIGADVASIAKRVMRQAKASGGLHESWATLVPPELAGVTAPRAISAAGVLTVEAQDAAAKYGLDRWVRGGGLAQLRAAASVTLRSVKIVLK